MSLHSEPIGEIRAETVRIARAAFPEGTVVTWLRDEFSALYRDEDFGGLYPGRGQPALTPWRLALVQGPPVPREPQRPAGGQCGACPDPAHRIITLHT